MPHNNKLASNSIFLLLLFIPYELSINQPPYSYFSAPFYSSLLASYWEKQKLLFLEKTKYPFFRFVPRTPALFYTIYPIIFSNLFSTIITFQLSIVPPLMLSSSILAISLLSTIFTTEPVTLHASLQYVLLTHIFSVLFPFNSCTPQGLCYVKNSSSREKTFVLKNSHQREKTFFIKNLFFRGKNPIALFHKKNLSFRGKNQIALLMLTWYKKLSILREKLTLLAFSSFWP